MNAILYNIVITIYSACLILCINVCLFEKVLVSTSLFKSNCPLLAEHLPQFVVVLKSSLCHVAFSKCSIVSGKENVHDY